MNRAKASVVLILALLVCGTGAYVSQAVAAADPSLRAIAGQVVDTEGKGVRGVAVRITLVEGKRIVTVFTNDAGNFQVKVPASIVEASPGNLPELISVSKLGYSLVVPGESGGGAPMASRQFVLRLASPEEIAKTAPAAYWTKDWPDGLERRTVALQCIQCHQLPGDNFKIFASNLGSVEKTQREPIWRAEVESMRQVSIQVASRASRKRFEGIGAGWRTSRESFLHSRAEDFIAKYLAKHLVTDFSTLPLTEEDMAIHNQAVNGVRIEEYWLEPEVNGWFREVAYSLRNRGVVGVDLGGDRIFKLSPESGDIAWQTILPGNSERVAPHTITADSQGLLWVSLEDINGVGRFDPKSNEWKIYRDLFGEKNMITHDFATDSNGVVAKDARGRIWLTVASHNHLLSLDPESGATSLFELPGRTDGRRTPTLPYGIVMESTGNYVWVSHHAADTVFKVKTQDGTVTDAIHYPEAYAPRRMSIDNNDRVWIAFSGEGAIGVIDPQNGKTTMYKLPVPMSNPYNVLWDQKRGTLWVGTTNVGQILEFDPIKEDFSTYILPAHNEAYIRNLSLDPESGDLWTVYASKLGEKAPVAIIKLSPEPRGVSGKVGAASVTSQ